VKFQYYLLGVVCYAVSAYALAPVLQEPEKLTELRRLGVTAPDFEKKRTPGVHFGGFINTDVFWDTRQVFGFRDGHELFFPLDRRPDVRGRDINAVGDFDEFAARTRLWALITGPNLAHFYSLGAVEIDFWGSNQTSIGQCRMRQAYLSIYDDFFTVLIGHYWHPIFLPEMFPATLSFDTGAPFEAICRDPQVRIEFQMDNTRLIIAALSEATDFKSLGPAADTSFTLTPIFDTKFCRNSMTPIITAQVQQRIHEHLVGAGVDAHFLRPRLETINDYKAHEWVSSLSAYVFGMLKYGAFQVKNKLIYVQNGPAYSMNGGYGIAYDDPITDHREYTNICVLSYWLEIMYDKKISPGLFIGIQKNLGARRQLALLSTVPGATDYSQLIYGLGQNIDIEFRVSPRILFTYKTLQFGAELEVTGARYGKVQRSGKVAPVDSVVNYRPWLSAFYYF